MEKVESIRRSLLMFNALISKISISRSWGNISYSYKPNVLISAGSICAQLQWGKAQGAMILARSIILGSRISQSLTNSKCKKDLVLHLASNRLLDISKSYQGK